MNPSKMWLTCPHCTWPMDLDPIACGTFIHGFIITEGHKQIDPHASKETCEKYIQEGKVEGCGKRILIIKSHNSDELIVKPVDYEK
jgi:hypothetical protein